MVYPTYTEKSVQQKKQFFIILNIQWDLILSWRSNEQYLHNPTTNQTEKQ